MAYFYRMISVAAVLFGWFLLPVGVAFGQLGGGFGNIEPTLLVNDPLFQSSTLAPHGQHWLHSTKVTYAWTLVGYNTLDYPYAIDHNDPNTTIAIIDSGIDMNHPEFEGKIHPASATIVYGGLPLIEGFCPCDPNDFDPPDPDNGPVDVEDRVWMGGGTPHGTISAGLIGALTDNETGIAGVCWDCSLLIIRIMPAQQSPCRGCRPSATSVAASIRYAAGWSPGDSEGNTAEWGPVRARVICTAFEGITGYNNTEQFCNEEVIDDVPVMNQVNVAIDQAYERGCIIIAITGNSASTPQDPCWTDDYPDEPACTAATSGTATNYPLAWHPKTITVGGACRTGQGWHCHSRINPLRSALGSCRASIFPDYDDTDHVPVLSVVAPIEDIVTTFAYDEVSEQGAEYGFLDSFSAGTSWASPQVAGIVALMLKVNPGLSFEDVKCILEATATDIGPTGYDKWTGYGLVNAREAVKYAMILCMPANFNGDESIDTLDPIDFLIAYGQGDVTADLDLDGEHTEADLAIFLSSYLAE
ncbi:MAG: S8 family serine peptidase [Phycisphaeraceae bacterium]|nr:S8 family serine peptidase [Phycisphaeraceae bacterium]MCW5761803.1 S8 family serine peptidase [Phycisphaeraceae bacterium]